MSDEDRGQIGLTVEGRATVKRLQDDLNWFGEARDVGRFALAYAIREGAVPGNAGSVETRWAPDTFDPDGEIRALVRALYPDSTTPIRLIESLIDQGLQLIAAGLDDGDEDPLSYIGPAPHEAEPSSGS